MIVIQYLLGHSEEAYNSQVRVVKERCDCGCQGWAVLRAPNYSYSDLVVAGKYGIELVEVIG